MHPDRARQADVGEIRQLLDPTFVMNCKGYEPSLVEAGRATYHNPFRQDRNPSLDVFLSDKGEFRIGDYAENWQGSVIDLLMRFDEDLTTAEAIDECRGYLAMQFENEWKGPNLDRPMADVELLADMLDACDEPGSAVDLLLGTRPGISGIDAADLGARFGVREDNGTIIMPYYDLDNELTGIKLRHPDNTKKNVAGSRLCLYGLNNAATDTTRPVVLVEGETDTWAADAALPGYSVLGVPGAGMKPNKLWPDTLAPSKVYLSFDGDDAGQAGALTWSEHLTDLGIPCVAVPLPSGHDVSMLEWSDYLLLVEEARPRPSKPEGIVRTNTGYYVESSQGKQGKQITNWTLDITERLMPQTPDDPIGFAGTLVPTGEEVVLTSEDLAGVGSMTAWDRRHGNYGFKGSAQDAQNLLSYLTWDSHVAPKGRFAQRVGLHDGDFVLPGLSFGLHDWHYREPLNGVGVESMLFITRPQGSRSYTGDIMALLDHRDRKYTWPILCWLAAAPVRPLFPRFPFLSVAGGSGSGKTTSLEMMLLRFSGSGLTTNITGTTPHGVASYFHASNAVPVMFDEYRQGAREDGLQALQQTLRDSYTGQVSVKGGMFADKTRVARIHTDTPVMVVGEQSITEQSHYERAVMLYLDRTDLDRAALRACDSVSPDLPGAFLRKLIEDPRETRLTSALTATEQHVPTLSDRMNSNLSVLWYGYDRLNDFCDYALPGPDFSHVVDEWKKAGDSNPYLDAVRWAYEKELDCVWAIDGSVAVAATDLLAEVNKARVFTLPANNTASMERYLISSHSGEEASVQRVTGGPDVRVVLIPLEEL